MGKRTMRKRRRRRRRRGRARRSHLFCGLGEQEEGERKGTDVDQIFIRQLPLLTPGRIPKGIFKRWNGVPSCASRPVGDDSRRNRVGIPPDLPLLLPPPQQSRRRRRLSIFVRRDRRRQRSLSAQVCRRIFLSLTSSSQGRKREGGWRSLFCASLGRECRQQ